MMSKNWTNMNSWIVQSMHLTSAPHELITEIKKSESVVRISISHEKGHYSFSRNCCDYGVVVDRQALSTTRPPLREDAGFLEY